MSNGSRRSYSGLPLTSSVSGLRAPNGPYEEPVRLEQVLDGELSYIRNHRHPQLDPEVVARSLVGLALSGGGIRSATTNLGILQALARMRILPLVDYLSTVSGGGYIGACLSSLLSWNGSREPSGHNGDGASSFEFAPQERPVFSTDWETFPLRAEETDPRGRLGKALVAHLRTHGNFLFARRGVFSREALRGTATLLASTLFTVIGFAVALFVAAALYLALMFLDAPDLPKVLEWKTPVVQLDTVRHPLVPGDSSIMRTRTSAVPCSAGIKCTGETSTAMHAPTFRDALRRNLWTYGIVLFSSTGARVAIDTRSPSTILRGVWTNVPNAWQPIVVAMFVGMAAGLLALWWMVHSLRVYLEYGHTDKIKHERGDSAEDGFERSVLRKMAFLFAALVFAMVIAVRLRWRSATPADQVATTLIPAAVLFGSWFTTYLLGVVLLAHQRRWTRRLRSLAVAFHAITGWGLALFFGAGVAPALIYALRDHAMGVGVSTLASLVVMRLLVRRGSGSERRVTLPAWAVHVLLNIAVTLAIVTGFVFAAAVLATTVTTTLAAVIVTAALAAVYAIFGWVVNLNKVGPQYFYRDRLAETYLLSELPDAQGRLELYRDAMELPLHELHGVCPKDPSWRNPAPYHLISAAINLAGSRDLTRKDRKSGYWLFSRLYCGSTHTGFRWTKQYRRGETKIANAVAISGAAASSAIGRTTFFAQAFATALFNIRLGVWMENPASARSLEAEEFGVFWPWYLIREFRMDTKESTRLVNLSDGGHTGDNLGLYPLLQRRCKIIVACDAECDPHLAFGSLTEALRQAYVDMGIDVDIDLSMIRPDPMTGLSRSHCAVGRIRYPDRTDQNSWLVYLKSSVTGDEPAPVVNYRSLSPAFPHETTVDQFFDDAQFESYRALGVHLAEETFGAWSAGDDFTTLWRHHAPRADQQVMPPAGAPGVPRGPAELATSNQVAPPARA